MTFRRAPPPPPKSDPPSMLLMRAIGDLQMMEGGEPITGRPLGRMDAIALMAGLVYIEIPALIEVGITAGYLEDDDAGGIGLSSKGQGWYERDLLKRE